MQDILKKLDLTDYIDSFSKLLARKKSIILEGDINLHHKIIQELSNYEINSPKKTANLDNALMHLQKQGVLKIYEIYEFTKIINYFNYLKRFNFEGKLKENIDKIIIPSEVGNICSFFDSKANIKDGIDEDYDRVKEAISVSE